LKEIIPLRTKFEDFSDNKPKNTNTDFDFNSFGFDVNNTKIN
jgi:hypothetical protein